MNRVGASGGRVPRSVLRERPTAMTSRFQIRGPVLGLLLLAFAGTGLGTPARADRIQIGTGSIDGVYYHAGRAICRALARSRSGADGDCIATPTAGSGDNLDGVADGTFTIAVAQADQQHDAVKGLNRFRLRGADARLRSLFSLHVEPFTLVARSESRIASLADLPGRRVNIGNPGSGHYETMALLMRASGWTPDTFALATQLAANEHWLPLCHNRIEAMVYTVGHPNDSVEKATRLCGARVVEVSGPAVDAILAEHPTSSGPRSRRTFT